MAEHKVNKYLLVYRSFALAVAILGIGYRFIDTFIRDGFLHSLNLLGYFTIQSGIMIILMFTILIVNQVKGHPESKVKPGLRGAVLLYALVTSIVFLTMLNDKVEMSGLSHLVLYVNHFLTAFLLLIDNRFTVPARSYEWKHIALWLIYPFGYLVFSVIESLLTGRFRYFFLNYTELGAFRYILSILFLVLFFSLLSSFIVFVNRRLKKVDG